MTKNKLVIRIACALLAVTGGTPAIACRDSDPIEPRRFLSADLVVVGRITNYRIVHDPYWRKMMQVDPDFKQRFASDFVRFDIQIERVLSGHAPPNLSVAWDAGWMREPDTLRGGPFVIGLRYPKANLPNTRPANVVDPEPILPTVISTGCGGDLLVESDSEPARMVMKLIASR